MILTRVSSLIKKCLILSYAFVFSYCSADITIGSKEFSHEELQVISQYVQNKAFFFIGYPGSGKGTQGKKLAQLLNMIHLSTGELFRAEAKKGTPIGLQMDYYMQKGEIIPKELTFQYLKQELSDSKYRNGFILDGYPKDLECFQFIIQTLGELQIEPTMAFYFGIDRNEVFNRLTGRLHCKHCERDYHKEFLKPLSDGLCDLCGGTLESRPDDSPKAINKRLDVFEKNTNPVVRQFDDLGILMRLDATNKPEIITKDILEAFLHSINKEESRYVNTSNPGKLEEYKKYFFPQTVVGLTNDLDEPQADPLTIIQYKASQFEDVLVDDVSLDIEGVDVGVNIRWFLDNLNSSEYIGRSCIFSCLLGLRVDNEIRVYSGKIKGTIVEPRGNGFGFGPYFLPEGASETLGEYMNVKYNPRFQAIQNFKANNPEIILPLLKEWSGEFQQIKY